MKAYLKFDLPEDQAEYEIANMAGTLHTCLCEMGRMIRTRLKYGDPSDAERKTLEELQVLIPYDLT